MKKFLALALVAVMLLSACLVGCGEKEPVNTGDSQKTEDTQKTEKTETTEPVGKPELAAGDIADIFAPASAAAFMALKRSSSVALSPFAG